MPDLSIVFCTRNREMSLASAVSCALVDLATTSIAAEVVIVDDGELDPSVVSCLRHSTETLGISFSYLTNDGPGRGLYTSRLTALRATLGEVVLFLDDDAEIGVSYCASLMAWFRDHPDIAGVGGVDRVNLPLGLSRLGSVYARAFLLRGRGPGDLSPSGLNHGQATWRLESSPFPTQYLHGCNMAFRRRALAMPPEHPWLEGHSPFEDLVLSRVAAAHGGMLIDPNLPVRHLAVAGGRGSGSRRLRARLRAHWSFAGRYTSASTQILLWSTAGLLAKDLALSVLGRSSFSLVEVLTAYLAFLRELPTIPSALRFGSAET